MSAIGRRRRLALHLTAVIAVATVLFMTLVSSPASLASPQADEGTLSPATTAVDPDPADAGAQSPATTTVDADPADARRAAPATCLRGCNAAGVLDGFVLGSLPEGLGPHESDFAYEWEDVAHRSRVWESGPDDTGAYSVDLTIKVLRGESLGDLAELRRYLTDYHERDPGGGPRETFSHRGRPGYHDADEAFWLETPGVGVEVRVLADRYSEADLMRTVRGIRPSGS